MHHRSILVSILLFTRFMPGAPPLEAAEKSLGQEAQERPPQPVANEVPKGNSPVPPGEDLPEWKVRLELARILSYLERYPDSIEEYRRVLQLNTGAVTARMELSRVLFWSGKSKEALILLEQVPEEDLEREWLKLKAQLLVTTGEYDRAAPLYRKLVESEEEDHISRYWLAEILSWQGHLKESIREYEILLKARPEDIQLRRKYGMVLSWDGQFERAAEALRKTLPEG